MVFDLDIDHAADILRAGGVVAFPTETVYGLGANAFDVRAVTRVFELKGRPRFDPLIVHVESIDQARQLVTTFPPLAQELAEVFWPGPLTLVLPKQPRVPDLVTAGLPTVAVRVPDHDMTRALIERAATALAGPSANRFGALSPTTAAHVRAEFGDSIDGVLDGGPCATGLESTVIALVDRPLVLRPGGVSNEQIERITGPLVQSTNPPLSDEPLARPAPGMLQRHYAPQTPMRLVDSIDLEAEAARAGSSGLLLFLARPTASTANFAAVEVLSPRGDVREAATNLFAALRRLDAMNLSTIVAERVPDRGLGSAINDRLRRGCAPE